MKKLLCAALALVLVLGLVGCGEKTKAKPEEEESASSASESAEPETSADTLVVYSPLPQEVLAAAVAGFTAQSGIKVKTVSDSADALIVRLGEESAAPKADVLFGAGAEIVQQAKALFATYQTSEKAQLDPVFLSKDDLYTPLTPMPIVLMYSKAQTTQAPTGWSSLASSAYSGWVAFANPQYSGTSYTALCVASQNKALGSDFIDKLGANLNGKMLDGISDVYKGIAAGKFAAGVTLEGSVYKYLEAGYENTVGIAYPAEGTTAAVEVSAVLAGSAREETAQKFVDYVSGSEFQQTLVTEFGMRTARTDIDDPESLTPRKDIKFIDYSVAQAVDGRQELLKQFAEAVEKSAPKAEAAK